MTDVRNAAGANFTPAARIASIGVSEILKIAARAQAMKREGLPIIILGAGEPDFDTPDHVKRAAIAAMLRGDTKYTALDGTPELKSAIREKFKRENALTFELDEITVAAGAKQILFNAMMATLNPGDEVIIPTPYWTTSSTRRLSPPGRRYRRHGAVGWVCGCRNRRDPQYRPRRSAKDVRSATSPSAAGRNQLLLGTLCWTRRIDRYGLRSLFRANGRTTSP
jgi:hypothetical protein